MAALAVVLFHIVNSLPAPAGVAKNYLLHVLAHWPVRLLWGGYEAVIVFFVLSGYVLMLPFLRGTPPRYGSFAVKRIVRLYPPYFVSFVLGALALLVFSTYRIPELTAAFNLNWNRPIGIRDILNNVLMLGNEGRNFINQPSWSLVHEMRISLIFPFLVMLLYRFGCVSVLLVAMLASFAANAASLAPFFDHYDAPWTLMQTVRFVSLFVMGMSIAMNRDRLVSMIGRWSAWVRSLAAILGLLLLGQYNAASETLRDNIVGCGFAILLVLVLSSPAARGVLERGLLVWLGRISYSLYLTHFIVIYALFYALHRVLPATVVGILAVPCALCVAQIFWRLVEKPSIAWARSTARAFDRVLIER